MSEPLQTHAAVSVEEAAAVTLPVTEGSMPTDAGAHAGPTPGADSVPRGSGPPGGNWPSPFVRGSPRRPSPVDLFLPPIVCLGTMGVGWLALGSGKLPSVASEFTVALLANLLALGFIWWSPRRLSFRGPSGPAALMTVVLVVPLALVSDRLLEHREELSAVARAILELRDPLEFAIAALLVVIVAPVAEEAYFRGVLYPWLASVVGRPTGNLLVSALFASLHPGSLSFLAIFALSLLWTLMVDLTRNLQTPVAGHVALNAVSLAVLATMSPKGITVTWIDISLVSSVCLMGYCAAGYWASRRLEEPVARTAPGLATLYSVGLAVLISITLASLIAGVPGRLS
ncbi:MAG: CPBP family intramembrane metalloprotease [Candidatus Riflebacteria bacterium]|nr:CPBP family intramembrane metalloprotease [Candidatus Riflebacteria bacterium]